MSESELNSLLIGALIGFVASFLMAVVSATLSYFFWRKQKLNEVLINKGYEVSEEIAVLFQDIVETDEMLYTFFQQSFSHIGNFKEKIENFEKLSGVYQSEYDRISELAIKRESLYNKLKLAPLYLNENIPDQIKNYLDIGIFHFESDGGLFVNTYYEKFFENIMNKTKHSERKALAKLILSNMRKLQPQ